MTTQHIDIIESVIIALSMILTFLLGYNLGWLRGFEEGCNLWRKAFDELNELHKEHMKSILDYFDKKE